MFQNISADFSTHLSNLGLFLLHSAQSHPETKVSTRLLVNLYRSLIVFFFYERIGSWAQSLSSYMLFITTLQVKIELSYQR